MWEVELFAPRNLRVLLFLCAQIGNFGKAKLAKPAKILPCVVYGKGPGGVSNYVLRLSSLASRSRLLIPPKPEGEAHIVAPRLVSE